MTAPKGFPSQSKDHRVGAQFATVEPLNQSQYGLSVVSHVYCSVVGTDTTEANADTDTNKYRIKATAHLAKKGDLINITSGTFINREIRVHAIPDANNIDLVEAMASAIPAGVTFQILRQKIPVVNSDGSLSVSVSASDISFKLDAVSTFVNKDTVTPANSRGLPVEIIGASGPINITAGDLNVSTSHVNDSMRIGDGTDLVNVTAANQLEVAVTAALPAGTNNIGDVDVLSQPARSHSTDSIKLGDGTEIASITASNQLEVAVTAALPTGANAIGSVSVSSSALPSGAATSANQVTELASLSSIDGKVPSNLTVTATRLLVDPSGVTSPISASSLPLPSGASTEATLSTLNGKIPSNLTVTSTRLLVDPSGVTQPVSIASTITARAATNTNGQTDNTALTATTATTATAPANTVGFILQAPSDNTHNIRFRIGGIASTTAGMQLEPGRDTGYIPCSANVSVCAITSGTNVFCMQWILSS